MKMSWKQVKTASDVEDVLTRFGGFHDSCLREIHLWTEHYVADNLSMSCPGHLDTHARLLFQRQFRNPSAIELVFHQVVGLCVVPSPENYDSIIFDASLTLKDGVFRWTDGEDQGTWIAARELWWREASEWMGSELRYGAGTPPPASGQEAAAS